jgi:hypothetical protein
MLTLENRTEAVLEAVGNRGEVLAVVHGTRASTDRSVVLVRKNESELVVWWVDHGQTVGSSMTHSGEYFHSVPYAGLGSEAYAQAWAMFHKRAKRIGWTG